MIAVRNGDEPRIRTLITTLSAIADHDTLMRLRRRLDEEHQAP
ncbi:hypothetical protein [Streptomyces sp. NPDC051546]